MQNEIKHIAIDAMGGDNAPSEIVAGAVNALSEVSASLILVGRQEAIETELSKHSYDKSRITVCNASEIIGMSESPTDAIRNKKDSSMVVGLKLLKEGKAQAFVSAGNTGAFLSGATVIVGRIKGIERPALGAMLPNDRGYTFLIDSGANVDAKPNYLLQFGQMGSIYMEHIKDIKKPRVGLVGIGAEKEKGNALTKEAYELLETSGLNFIGNVEARDIPLGGTDVAVCDAFVGNVILKYSEGFAKGFMNIIKTELTSTLTSKIGALLSKNAFRRIKKRFDYHEIGGAPFLGLKALVVKAHGSSDALAIKNAVKQCMIFIDNDIVGKIERSVSENHSGGGN